MEKLLVRCMEAEERKTSLMISAFLAIVLLMGGIIVMVNYMLTVNDAENQANANSLIVSAFFYLIHFLAVRKGWLTKSSKYIATFFNISIISFTLFQYGIVQGWVHGLRSMTLLFYCFPFFVAVLYVSPRLCFFTGVVSIIQYSALSIYAIHSSDILIIEQESFKLESYSWAILIYVDMIFLTLTTLALFTSKRFKSILLNTFQVDISAQKEKEEADMRTRFFINLAHEIKTPLTLIDNFFRRYEEQNELSVELAVVGRNIRKMKRDIVHFMDIEKIKRGASADFGAGCSNLSQEAEDVLTIYRTTYPEKQWSTQIEKNLTAVGNPVFWDRVFYNLMDNAVKYSPENAVIQVTVIEVNGHIELKIRNSGKGITSEKIHHLFEPYYQLDHTRTADQGMGIGLALVKTICEKFDVDITVQSKTGEWVEVKLVIPKGHVDSVITGERKKTVELIPPTSFSHHHKSSRDLPPLLLVEDNQELRSYLQSELSESYKIFEAKNGTEAMAILAQGNSVDLILSDIMMDGMDGIQFLEALRADPTGEFIPLIFLTAKADEETKERCHELGSVDFIEKPFDIRYLNRKLETASRMKSEMESKARKRLNKALEQFLGNNSGASTDMVNLLKTRYDLSDREIEVALQLRSGDGYKVLADRLRISVNTLKTHTRHIFDKCGVGNKTELINLFNTLV